MGFKSTNWQLLFLCCFNHSVYFSIKSRIIVLCVASPNKNVLNFLEQ